MESRIKAFLDVGLKDTYTPDYVNWEGFGYGSGYGNGNGFGYGSGYGNGYGDGDGDGYGDGDGNGYGYSYGNGNGFGYGDVRGGECGIVMYDNYKVYVIDTLPTIILNIRGSIASGFIIKPDLTLEETFIAKVGNYFAHGCSVKNALVDAQYKYNATLSPEDKIKMFLSTFNMKESTQ